MTIIHKQQTNNANLREWDGARTREYPLKEGNVLETWLIGKAENAQNFALRYYNVAVGGKTREESHAHDHGIYILHGKALICSEGNHETQQGDVIYIPPHQKHQIHNIGEEPLGFLCIIPARRTKGSEEVWAEGNLFD